MFDLLKNSEGWHRGKDNEVASTCKRTIEMVYLERKLDKEKLVGRPEVEKLLQRNAYET